MNAGGTTEAQPFVPNAAVCCVGMEGFFVFADSLISHLHVMSWHSMCLARQDISSQM